MAVLHIQIVRGQPKYHREVAYGACEDKTIGCDAEAAEGKGGDETAEGE